MYSTWITSVSSRLIYSDIHEWLLLKCSKWLQTENSAFRQAAIQLPYSFYHQHLDAYEWPIRLILSVQIQQSHIFTQSEHVLWQPFKSSNPVSTYALVVPFFTISSYTGPVEKFYIKYSENTINHICLLQARWYLYRTQEVGGCNMISHIIAY